jgi:hypothetical protein
MNPVCLPVFCMGGVAFGIKVPHSTVYAPPPHFSDPMVSSHRPPSPHPHAWSGQLLPLEARDWCYELVSRYRHLFGEKDSCRIPSESEMDRFLD